MQTLNQLIEKREHYKNLSWKSSNGTNNFIIYMDDDHLVNVLRNVANKLLISQQFPLVDEFQKYNGIAYAVYADALYNEYQLRKIELQKRINMRSNLRSTYEDYVDNEAQHIRDLEDYINGHSYN